MKQIGLVPNKWKLIARQVWKQKLLDLIYQGLSKVVFNGAVISPQFMLMQPLISLIYKMAGYGCDGAFSFLTHLVFLFLFNGFAWLFQTTIQRSGPSLFLHGFTVKDYYLNTFTVSNHEIIQNYV